MSAVFFVLHFFGFSVGVHQGSTLLSFLTMAPAQRAVIGTILVACAVVVILFSRGGPSTSFATVGESPDVARLRQQRQAADVAFVAQSQKNDAAAVMQPAVAAPQAPAPQAPDVAVITPAPVVGTGVTYAPVNGNILAQMIPRQYPEAECSDTYSENGFPKFRSTRRSVCTQGDAGAAYRQTPWNPGHGHNAAPPSTIELHHLVKQLDGSSTIPCTVDSGFLQQTMNENGGWYDSGMTHIHPRLRLHSQGPTDLACTNPIEETAIFIKREKGGGNNQYHELAQMFTAYFAKHVHGISDHGPDAHNMRVIVFDKHDRSDTNPFDKFFYKAFTRHGPEAYESLPAGTCFRRAIFVYPSTRSIFWIPFGHKPSCQRYPLLEGFQRFMLRGTTGNAAVATPKHRTICFITRGSRDSRQVRGEGDFIHKLRNANPNAKIVTGVFGEGDLREFSSQIAWISQCTILTGTHGAGLTHLLFLPDEAIIVEHHTPGHGSFRGIAKGLGHTFIHVETHDASVGNFAAWGRALRSAWQSSNNFYHMHENTELNVPGDL
jgi:hypothetical protein